MKTHLINIDETVLVDYKCSPHITNSFEDKSLAVCFNIGNAVSDIKDVTCHRCLNIHEGKKETDKR